MTPAGLITVLVAVTSDEDLAAGHAVYRAALAPLGRPLEFIYVLDGALPQARRSAEALAGHADVEVLGFGRTLGEGAALATGLRQARGAVVLTLPPVPTVDAEGIRGLLEALDGCDMVIGRRLRDDAGPPPRGKAERLLGLLLGSRFDDVRSNLRAMTRIAAQELADHSAREQFLPLVAEANGLRVREIPVRLLPGSATRRSPVPDTGVALDVLALYFVLRFLRRPFRFFGGIGFVVLALGALATAWLIFERLVLGVGLADRPALILSTLMVVLGIQILAVGLIGEIIAFAFTRDIKAYKVERVVD
jgi:hypothetical protein